MRFEELAVRFALKTGMSEKESRAALNAFFEFLSEELQQQLKPDNQIKIQGLGTFMLRKIRGRMRKHPKTKLLYKSEDRYAPFLRFSPQIVERIKQIQPDGTF